MEVNKIYQGNCLELIKQLDDKSVDCVITSPPYWQLRDYKWDGQWGLEPTYQMYLENLWSLMDEIYRVLKDEGTCWINLGDSYSTQSLTNAALAKGRSYSTDSTYLTNRGESELLIKDKTLPNKCLMLIPHRFAIGCIDRGWIMRNDIIWGKRNGMPESVTDRFSKKHEYVFFMTKKTKYYFNLTAVREAQSAVSINRYQYSFTGQEGGESNNYKGNRRQNTKYSNGGRMGWTGEKSTEGHPDGKNPGTVSDFWDIITLPSSDKHYATFNKKLIGKPILAGCPIGGIILDPFCGTATTGCCAIELNRKFIGFEGSEKYVKIANTNIIPYLSQKDLCHEIANSRD